MRIYFIVCMIFSRIEAALRMEQHYVEEMYHSFSVSSPLSHYLPYIFYTISIYFVALILLNLFTMYRCKIIN